MKLAPNHLEDVSFFISYFSLRSCRKNLVLAAMKNLWEEFCSSSFVLDVNDKLTFAVFLEINLENIFIHFIQLELHFNYHMLVLSFIVISKARYVLIKKKQRRIFDEICCMFVTKWCSSSSSFSCVM